MKKEHVSFFQYKRNNVVFSQESGKDKIAVRFSKGKQQVIIPNGTCLIHVSPVAGIKELKPAFRSKTRGKYMYPSPRCFFTIAKEIKPTKAGLEDMKLYKYTPRETLRTAYIDPTYTDYKTGSLYIETSNPIQVVAYNEKMKSIFKESSDSIEETITKYKLLIFECERDQLITHEQADILLDYLK